MKRTRPMLERSFPLEDIAIRAGGTGRTVVAYAAMFDAPYEVRDVHGHYFEELARTSFNRALSHGAATRAVPLYNHGMTVWSTPSERYSMPLGTPVEIRAETRGLLTVTEYAKTDLADEVLELIRTGAITSQSFRGPIVRSTKTGRQSGLDLIRRDELGLTDYGPTPFAVNRDAEIVGVRSQLLIDRLRDELADLDDDERAHVLAEIAGSTPQDPPPAPEEDTPPPPAATLEEPPAPEEGPSLEVIAAEQAQRRRRASL